MSYLFSFYDDVINSKIYLQTTSKTITDREKKRGRQKYKKLNISRSKIFFIVFEGLSFGEK